MVRFIHSFIIASVLLGRYVSAFEMVTATDMGDPTDPTDTEDPTITDDPNDTDDPTMTNDPTTTSTVIPTTTTTTVPTITTTPTPTITTTTTTTTSPSSLSPTQDPNPPPINPYSQHCPNPPTFTISSYLSTTNTTTTPPVPLSVSFRISYGSSDPNISSLYGNAAFHCPRLDRPGTHTEWTAYDGMYDLLCDYNGLVRVFTDGEGGFGSVRRWFFCEDAPKNGKYKYYTIESNASNLNISSSLTCSTSPTGVKTCTQGDPVTFPVQAYSLGGTMGYSTMDQEGRYVSSCESRGPGKNPMVLEESGCVWAAGSVA